MSRFKTKNTKVKKTVIVGNADTEILPTNNTMNDEVRRIQNLGSGDLYVSFGSGSATEGTNGEELLKPNDKINTPYQGEIHGISPTNASASVLTL